MKSWKLTFKEIGDFKEQPDGGRPREKLVDTLKHWGRT